MENNTIVVNAENGEVTYNYTPNIEQENYIPTKEELQQLYKERVVQLIRAMYDINAELDVQRNRDTEPTKFQEYFNYVEQCKIQARAEIQY